jgi:phosphohistidine phosphatase SixA
MGRRPRSRARHSRACTIASAATSSSWTSRVGWVSSTAIARSRLSTHVVVRHAHARHRKDWQDEDTLRPLRAEGKDEAHRLVELLTAYDVDRVISSNAVRCVDTVQPYVDAHQVKLKLDASLSEDGFDRKTMKKRVARELDKNKRTAICSHRPVLPDLQKALGLDPVALDPGALLVLHRRDGRVESVEHHVTP